MGSGSSVVAWTPIRPPHDSQLLLLFSPSLDTLGTQADYKPGHKTSISTPIFGNCEVKVLYQVNLEVKICGKVLKAFQKVKII